MNTTALITWASSGIGRELAIIHAQHGGDLILVARRSQKLEELKQDLLANYDIQIMIITKDLTQPTAVQDLYDEITTAWVQVDYLINNAWFGGQGAFVQRDRNDDKNMILLNIMALTELTKVFLWDFVSKNTGRIVNISSIASFVPGPLQAVYFATKSYVQSFTNALSYELKDTNITVTNVMPGATETEFAKTSGLEDSWLFAKTYHARGVAQDAYQGMLDGRLDVITGVGILQKISLYFSSLIPKNMIMKHIHAMQTNKK